MLPLMAGVNATNLPESLKTSFAQAQEMSANKENLEKIRKENRRKMEDYEDDPDQHTAQSVRNGVDTKGHAGT